MYTTPRIIASLDTNLLVAQASGQASCMDSDVTTLGHGCK